MKVTAREFVDAMRAMGPCAPEIQEIRDAYVARMIGRPALHEEHHLNFYGFFLDGARFIQNKIRDEFRKMKEKLQ